MVESRPWYFLSLSLQTIYPVLAKAAIIKLTGVTVKKCFQAVKLGEQICVENVHY